MHLRSVVQASELRLAASTKGLEETDEVVLINRKKNLEKSYATMIDLSAKSSSIACSFSFYSSIKIRRTFVCRL